MGSELKSALNTIVYLCHAKLEPEWLLFDKSASTNYTLTVRILSHKADQANSRESATGTLHWTGMFCEGKHISKVWERVDGMQGSRPMAHYRKRNLFFQIETFCNQLSKSTRGDGSPSVKADNMHVNLFQGERWASAWPRAPMMPCIAQKVSLFSRSWWKYSAWLITS